MIYWIDWPYWNWKTWYSIYWIKKAKKLYGKKLIIFSNIKMYDIDYIDINDVDLLPVLQAIYKKNQKDRENPNNFKILKKNWKKCLIRQNMTRFIILLDESWSVMNKHQKTHYDTKLIYYINQTRKLFYDLFLISARWDENFKQLRDKVSFWFRIEKKFKSFPFLSDLRFVYLEEREDDWKTLITEKFIWKDQKWDKVLKERPKSEFYEWYYAPFTYDFYDDLFINNKDIIDDLIIQPITDIITKKTS